MRNTATLHTTVLAGPTTAIPLTGLSWSRVAIGDRVLVECDDYVATATIVCGRDDEPQVALAAVESTIGPGRAVVRWPRAVEAA